MGQILKDKNNDSNDSRLIPKKNAKSVFVVDSENNLHKLQEAVEQLDELEFVGENPTEEEIQKSLMANNYEAPKEEEPVIEVLEEPVEEEVKPSIKEIVVNYFKNIDKRIKLGVVCILAMILIIFVVLFVRYEKYIHTYKMIINGDEIVNLYEGGLYKDKGVTVYNYNGEEKKGLVKISAHIDTDSVGEYYVKYTVNNFWKKNEISRKVVVLPNPLDNIYFTLNGDEEVDVKLNSKYKDPGYNIRSDDNQDYKKYVTVSSNVDTSKIGTYEVKYLIQINKKKQELVRKVRVTGKRYTVKFSTKPTSKDLKISITSNINNFDYFMVEGHKVLKDDIVYTVTSNGTYTITMVSTSGKKDDIVVKISNIDKTGPTGSCNAWMATREKTTTVNCNVKDDSRVASYRYNGKTYYNSSFSTNVLYKSGNVEVVDEAGNSSKINCKYLFSPIKPTNNNVIMRFDGSTMKYWIEKPTNTYLITHIWVEDPYNQFRVAIPREFPQLERAGTIMTIASNRYGYWNKAMIGANASGMVSDGFNFEVARRYPQWKNSSKSPLVIVDGKVLRNFSNLDMSDLHAVTYAMGKNGYFLSFSLTNDNKSLNIENAKKIINSGAKYTFAFSPILIKGGKIWDGLENSPDVRQAIGQIDKNNFIIVTNTVGINNREAGLGHRHLATIMYNLGCQTAFNTDGGGSTNLIYKNRNTHAYTGIVTTTRDVPDIMYFVEK